MATKYSDRFASATAGGPVNNRVARPIGGSVVDTGSMAALGLVAADLNWFIAVPVGAELHRITIDAPDLDTGTNTLVADVVLRTTDASGANVDTVLVSGVGPLTAAGVFTKLLARVKVPESQLGYGLIGIKPTTGANVAGVGTVLLSAEYN